MRGLVEIALANQREREVEPRGRKAARAATVSIVGGQVRDDFAGQADRRRVTQP